MDNQETNRKEGKNMKKTLTIVLSVLVICTIIVSSAYAAEPQFRLTEKVIPKISNFNDYLSTMEVRFDRQIAELRRQGFISSFLTELYRQRRDVTAKAAKMMAYGEIGEGNEPFLPAIDFSYGSGGGCGWPKLKYKDKKIQIVDKMQFLGLWGGEEHDPCPYYIFDVSRGHEKGILGLSADEAKKKLISLGRRPLDVVAGGFLFFLTDSVSKNGLLYAGSSCHGKVPLVYMKKDGEVYVDCGSFTTATQIDPEKINHLKKVKKNPKDAKSSERDLEVIFGTVSCAKEEKK